VAKRRKQGVRTPSGSRPGQGSGTGGTGGSGASTSGSGGLSTTALVALVAIVAVIGVGLAVVGLNTRSGASASPSASVPAEPSTPAAASTAPGGSAVAAGDCPTTQPPALAAGEKRTATIQTAKGDIEIEIDGALGPNAAGNFVALAECGYYDGVVFHRLAPGFVIQGGDGQYGREPNVDMGHVGQGGPGYEFPDDPVTVPYTRGLVAMANSGANTNGSQFFITLDDLPSLPPSYSVFGRVTKGMEVVDAIAAMPNAGGQSNQAIDPVAMDSVTVAP
jgi:cyclophilin family peptidyl-prolyl cis-trans isomerase